jgi:hypothetical protein
MKIKHNKKRNTAFIYEVLVRELTKSVISKDSDKKEKITKILKESFSKSKNLKKELDTYHSLSALADLPRDTIEKVVLEAKIQHSTLDQSAIFEEQSEMISKINKQLGISVYDNFVPNYKNLATIYSIFNNSTSIKSRVLLEQSLIKSAIESRQGDKEQVKQPIDNLVYKSFVKSFNEKYHGELTESQKTLMTKFVTSFADGGLELKMFLNEEVGELKSSLKEIGTKVESEDLKTRISEVVMSLEEMSNQEVTNGMVEKVLKVQQLKEEIESYVS